MVKLSCDHKGQFEVCCGIGLVKIRSEKVKFLKLIFLNGKGVFDIAGHGESNDDLFTVRGLKLINSSLFLHNLFWVFFLSKSLLNIHELSI